MCSNLENVTSERRGSICSQMVCSMNFKGFSFNKWDIFPLYSLHIDSLSFVLFSRNRSCAHAASRQGRLVWPALNLTTGNDKTRRILTHVLGHRETGSCGEMVNVFLNTDSNVIISKSAEPSRPGGRGIDRHFTS